MSWSALKRLKRMRMAIARTRMRARNVQGGMNWDDDELAQCLSRLRRGGIPFAMVWIQSGHICYTVIVALLQIASRTATKVLSPKY